MYHDFLGPRGLQRTHMDTLKPKIFKIDNIHCERGFLYILGDPGPQCAGPFLMNFSLMTVKSNLIWTLMYTHVALSTAVRTNDSFRSPSR